MSISDILIVMDNGVVKQIGPPTEIYERPVDEFVANFVGHINFFKGIAGKISGGKMVFKTEHGNLMIQKPPFNISPEDRLKAVVRPESIDIVRPDSKPSNQMDAIKNLVEGRIDNCMYIGAIMRYTILAGQQTIYVDEADPQYCGILQPGDDVTLFLKDTIHLLKEDEKSLSK